MWIAAGGAAFAYAAWKLTQPPQTSDVLAPAWKAMGQAAISGAVAQAKTASAGTGVASSSGFDWFNVSGLVENELAKATATQKAVASIAIPVAGALAPIAPLFRALNSLSGGTNTSDPWAANYTPPTDSSGPNTSDDLNQGDFW